MKKVKNLAVIAILLMVIIFNNIYILATDEENIVSNDVNIEENEEIKQQKAKVLDMINECIKTMKTKLIAIDNKEKKAKSQKEFENYPAIRLNIDTPFFGFIAMVNNKLKIRNDVSTVDIAQGYSIDYIINKNKIKLPDFKVGSIVVTTREVTIDENMSYEDATVTLLKIMQYMSQIDSANEFLDYQINKTFKGYIDKEKSEKIQDVKNRNQKIITKLNELDEKIIYLHIINNDEKKLKEIVDEYDKISAKTKEINIDSNDMLMSNETLTSLQKEVILLESELIEFEEEIQEEYEKGISSVNIEKMLKNIKKELEKRRDEVEDYIDDSTYTKKIENENKNKETKTDDQNASEEIITKYEITSKNTVEYLDTLIESIDEKISKYEKKKDDKNIEEIPKTDDPIDQEVANKTEVTGIEENQLTKEDKIEVINEVYKIYQEFLTRENKFYLDNVNFLIDDTTKKIADLTGKTDGDFLEYMKYMYIELPDKLKEYLNNYNMNSINEVDELKTNLKNELENIVKSNIGVNKLYKEMIEEELKS